MDGYVDHLTPVVLAAINTGMRRGELLSMTWADINWEARMLTTLAVNAKSGRQRQPMAGRPGFPNLALSSPYLIPGRLHSCRVLTWNRTRPFPCYEYPALLQGSFRDWKDAQVRGNCRRCVDPLQEN